MPDKIKIGIACDHGGFDLKEIIKSFHGLRDYDLIDFGADSFIRDDDYPDFVIPLAKAVAAQKIQKGIAICSSGVGASITANKISGVKAALIGDTFSAHQGVEDDKMNLICLGGMITGASLALEIIMSFLHAEFTGAERHLRRIRKFEELEK